MDNLTALSIGYPLGLGLAAVGAGLGLGRAVGAAMEAMGRQPEAIGRIQTAMIIGCAFIEALAIYALISVFLIPRSFSIEPDDKRIYLVPAAYQATVESEETAMLILDSDGRIEVAGLRSDIEFR